MAFVHTHTYTNKKEKVNATKNHWHTFTQLFSHSHRLQPLCSRKGTTLLKRLFACNSRAKWRLAERFIGRLTVQNTFRREKKNFQRAFIELYLRSASLESFHRDDFRVLRKPLPRYPKMEEYRQMNQIDIVKSEAEKLADMVDLIVAKQKGYIKLEHWETPKALFFDDELKEYTDEIPWLRDDYFTINCPEEPTVKQAQPPKQQEVVLVPVQQKQLEANAKPSKRHDRYRSMFNFSTLRNKFKSNRSSTKDEIVISAPILAESSAPNLRATTISAVDPRLIAALKEEQPSPSSEKEELSQKTPNARGPRVGQTLSHL